MKDAMNEADPKRMVKFTYTNYRGITSDRQVVPIRIEFCATKWHKEEQWILHAFDVNKQKERSFAMRDIMGWEAVFV